MTWCHPVGLRTGARSVGALLSIGFARVLVDPMVIQEALDFFHYTVARPERSFVTPLRRLSCVIIL